MLTVVLTPTFTLVANHSQALLYQNSAATQRLPCSLQYPIDYLGGAECLLFVQSASYYLYTNRYAIHCVLVEQFPFSLVEQIPRLPLFHRLRSLTI